MLGTALGVIRSASRPKHVGDRGEGPLVRISAHHGLADGIDDPHPSSSAAYLMRRGRSIVIVGADGSRASVAKIGTHAISPTQNTLLIAAPVSTFDLAGSEEIAVEAGAR